MKCKIDKKYKHFFFIISAVFVLLVIVYVFDYYKSEEHPRSFSYDNVLILDGKPFFPIGIYSVNPLKRWDPPTAFDEIKAAGFNSVHTYEFEPNYLHEYIDKADSVGLKVLIYPGNRLKDQKDIENIKYFVNNFSESTTILAWYLADEPEQNAISSEEVKRYHDIIKEIDTHHLTSLCVGNPSQYRKYVDISDVFIVEPYPIRSGQQYQITMVSDFADDALDAMKATGSRKPLWVALQAFGYQNEENKGWGWDREPTKHEMKAMTYLAIVKGASGIFYYTYHGSQYFIKDSPEHWENLKVIVKELETIYPLLVSGEADRDVVNTIKTDAVEYSLFWATRQVAEGNILIKPGIYLIVVNGSKNFVTASFELDNIFSVAEVLREDRTLSYSDRIFSDYFEPYGVHIYSLQ